MLISEDQTANARAPVIKQIKTVEGNSWKNEHELNFRDENFCLLAKTRQLLLANMETTVLLLKNSQLQASSLWICWWGNNQTTAAREPRIRKLTKHRFWAYAAF